MRAPGSGTTRADRDVHSRHQRPVDPGLHMPPAVNDSRAGLHRITGSFAVGSGAPVTGEEGEVDGVEVFCPQCAEEEFDF